MSWVVDTCLLIDVAEADPRFGIPSASLLDRLRSDGLIVCPVTDVELAPIFGADDLLQKQFLQNLAVSAMEPWTDADTRAARRAWNDHVIRRRAGSAPKRPLADILIGSFAQRFDGILTRNESDFRQLFPKLRIVVP